jgi:hypothetical protein
MRFQHEPYRLPAPVRKTDLSRADAAADDRPPRLGHKNGTRFQILFDGSPQRPLGSPGYAAAQQADIATHGASLEQVKSEPDPSTYAARRRVREPRARRPRSPVARRSQEAGSGTPGRSKPCCGYVAFTRAPFSPLEARDRRPQLARDLKGAAFRRRTRHFRVRNALRLLRNGLLAQAFRCLEEAADLVFGVLSVQRVAELHVNIGRPAVRSS